MVVARDSEERARLDALIRRLLERRPAVAVGELCARAGADEGWVRARLEPMLEKGDVARLRPIGYASGDRDFFCAVRPAAWRPDNELKHDETIKKRYMMKDMKRWMAGLAAAGIVSTTALGAEEVKLVVDGSTTVGPVAKAFAEYYMGKNPNVTITVSESGSGNGAKSLINGVCDVATLSRPMKASEIQSAKDAGSLAIEHVVAMDGIALVVHPSNPVQDLTLEQIRAIYAGKTRNWKDLGGPDQPIVVISRDTNSGTYETFETMVMNKEKMGDKVEYVGSNGAIRQRVLSTPAAVGYVGLAFIEGVKALTVNGIEATPEQVLAKKYPISRPLYFYTNGRPKAGTPLADFVGLSDTAEGKKLVEETGFIPLK